MHPFIQSYAQEQIEHWPWWETFRIMWNWAKQRCSSPRRAVPHTPYAVDAGTHKTVKTCVTLTGTLMTLRAAIHPSSCVRSLARTCLSIWQSLASPILSRTPVRVVCFRLKQTASSRHLRRVLATKWQLGKVGGRQSGSRRQTRNPRTHQITEVALGTRNRKARHVGKPTQYLDGHSVGENMAQNPRHPPTQKIGSL